MKSIPLIISLLFTISFVGCSEKEADTQPTTEVEKPANRAEIPEESEEPEVPEQEVIKMIPERSGKQLFAKCISCHGPFAEKSALSRSQIIRGWNQEKIINALNGYKDDSYGGEMKQIMKSQIGSYSQEEIKRVAEYISNL